ncbi:hypothetical protein [Streptacidiphilus cavernicola]|uniref:DNA gyrase inhibitor YacG n=1 Tax=Streptacidiphilus cavernicola TaxID=3342716 RepID=A0ABV6VXY1_9ACTN
MPACLECGHPIPEDDTEPDGFCSYRCALLQAQYMPLPDTAPEGW